MNEPFRGKNVRWYDTNGKRVKPNAPGAKKEVTESVRYFGYVNLANGKRKKVKLYATLVESRKKLSERQLLEDRRASGLVDDQMEHAKTSIVDHLKLWKESLDARPITQERRELLVGRMKKLIEAAKWQRLTDISEDSLLIGLGKLKAKGDLKISARTRNHYLRHAVQFLRWCRKGNRLNSDPLFGLVAERVDHDSRHDRRILTQEEQQLLITTTTESAVVYHGMDGKSRAMLYQVALATGFRRSELRKLTRESFDLAAGTVSLSAKFTKNRRRAFMKLPPKLVERLREWFGSGRQTWNDLTNHSSKMLKPDLTAAGILYCVADSDGRKLYVDFHAFRHTFCTAVAESGARLGISIKSQMKLTRHTSVELYIKTYVKENQEDVERIMADLPDPLTAFTKQAAG